jgi:hypothetical protein
MHLLLSKLVLMVRICHRGLNRITKNYKKSEKVPFKIAGVGCESKWHVVSGARTISSLDLPRQTIEVDFLMKKVTSVKPRVLIGQDNQTLMVARKVVEPNPLGLMLTKTKLGWIV